MDKKYEYFSIHKAIYDHDFQKWFITSEHGVDCVRHQDLPYELAVNIFESEKEKQTIKEVAEELSEHKYWLRYEIMNDENQELKYIKPRIFKKE